MLPKELLPYTKIKVLMDTTNHHYFTYENKDGIICSINSLTAGNDGYYDIMQYSVWLSHTLYDELITAIKAQQQFDKDLKDILGEEDA